MANTYLRGTIQTPSSLLITAATKNSQMAITVSEWSTVTETVSYIVGMAVRLFIPITYGMWQASDRIATIVGVSGSVLTLDLDSSRFDTFTVPSGRIARYATIAPAGSRNYVYNNGSKLVSFQSLNNRWN